MLDLQKLETVEIPLSKLALWEGNVRTSGAEEGLDELIASICSVGLLQSLVVKKASRGTFVIGAGKRRFLALSQLATQGDVKRSYPVPCRVAPDDADLQEISLAENVIRLDMTVYQEVSAFRAMVDAGQSAADVAARFGVSEKVVKGRLALARVSPALWKLYEAGELTLGVLQAFTLTDDHATQERIWNGLQEWDRTHPNVIREILLQEEIPATDPRVRFVGLGKYEAAGGFVRRDLFCEGEEGASIADVELLTRLVNEKLQAVAAEVAAEGWKWIEVHPSADDQSIYEFRRIQPTRVPLSEADTATVAELESKKAMLQERVENDPEADEDATYDEMELLQDQIDKTEAEQLISFDAAAKARCGAIIAIGPNGEPKVIGGLLRNEDAAHLGEEQGEAGDEESSQQQASNRKQQYSATLIETLTTIKTAAIAAELSQQPQVALAAVVHALVVSHFKLDLQLYGSDGCIQIHGDQPNLRQAAASPAFQTLSAQQTDWLGRLPKTPESIWDWCLEQPVETLLSLLAFCTGLRLNAIQTKADWNRKRAKHADALATALNMDMRNHFTPTAENFFSRISKPQIIEAMTEAGKATEYSGAAKMKKASLAELAEKAIANTGWLPTPIRTQTEVVEVKETEELSIQE